MVMPLPRKTPKLAIQKRFDSYMAILSHVLNDLGMWRNLEIEGQKHFRVVPKQPSNLKKTSVSCLLFWTNAMQNPFQ